MQVKNLNLSTESEEIASGWPGRLIKQIELGCNLTPEEYKALGTGKFKLNLNIEIEGAMMLRGEVVCAVNLRGCKIENQYIATFAGDDYRIKTEVQIEQ